MRPYVVQYATGRGVYALRVWMEASQLVSLWLVCVGRKALQKYGFGPL